MNTPSGRKPGRPPNCERNANIIPHRGISATPSRIEEGIKEIVFELIYDKPNLFKKIFTITKSMQVSDLYFSAETEELKIYAKSPEDKSEIYIKINGCRMNNYYIDSKYSFQLKYSKLAKVISSIHKNCTQIQFFLTRYTSSSQLGIKLIDDIIHREDEYNIDTISLEPCDWDRVEAELDKSSEYALKFDMQYGNFKQVINESKNMSDKLRIEKCPGDPTLYMSLVFTDGGAEKKTKYSDPAAINMRNQLNDNEILGVSVNLDYIKPLLSGSQISETITISIDDKFPKMIFDIPMNFNMNGKNKVPDTNACTVSMLVNTVNSLDIGEPVMKNMKKIKARSSIIGTKNAKQPEIIPEIVDED